MSERNSARTKLIGLRRLPQPPMPSVIPLSSDAMAWVSEINLLRISDTVTDHLSYFFIGAGEIITQLIGDSRQIQFKGKTLFKAVATLDIPQVNAIEAFFGSANHRRVFVGDTLSDFHRRIT